MRPARIFFLFNCQTPDAIKDITVKLRKKAMKILTLKKERSMINEAKNIEKR